MHSRARVVRQFHALLSVFQQALRLCESVCVFVLFVRLRLARLRQSQASQITHAPLSYIVGHM